MEALMFYNSEVRRNFVFMKIIKKLQSESF